MLLQLGRPSRITAPSGHWTTYNCDQNGRRSIVRNSNNTTTSYQYDTAGRLTGMTTSGPAGTISSYRYSYDAVGNRTAVQEATTILITAAQLLFYLFYLS